MWNFLNNFIISVTKTENVYFSFIENIYLHQFQRFIYEMNIKNDSESKTHKPKKKKVIVDVAA